MAQVLDECMAPGQDVGGGSLFEPAHGIQALLQMAMIALQAVVQVLRSPVLRVWQDGT